MRLSNVPSKEAVREYMVQRQYEHDPPPSLEEIRRQLGWDVIEAERKKQQDS
ncbi:MAG TPA: hypothetical protein VNW52_06530 [Burkholderiaceae bacterium]|jgi:hypothetical protein|nr:hypothetical protein [Burkholderiaceae bacterium]